MRSLRSVWTGGTAFLLGTGLLAGFAAPSWAGEKIQFSGRKGSGGSTDLNPDRNPAFAPPDFLNGPKFGGSPSDGLAAPIAVPYVSPPVRLKRDERKDWTLDERDQRDQETSPEALLNRRPTDRAPDESRPQTRTEKFLAEQERLAAKQSATRDTLTTRSFSNSLDRPNSLLTSTNRTEPFGSTSGTLTNGFQPFKTDVATIHLPGAQLGSGLAQKDGKPLSPLQLKGAGFNSSFMEQSARMEDFKKFLNSRPNVLAGGNASAPAGERGSLGKAGNSLSGDRGVAELPAMSGQRSGFDFGGSFSGAASGRPTVLNDLNSMRLGAPVQVAPVTPPSEPARREHTPVILQIPKRTF